MMPKPPPEDSNYLPSISDPDLVAHLLEKRNTVITSEVERKLVEYAKRGEKDAFEVLYLRYSKPLWNKLVGLVANRQVVEDLHQETFMRAWDNLHKLNHHEFGRWLYRIGANMAIDYLRRNKKLAFLSSPEFELDEEHSSASDPEKYVCELDFLQQALSKIGLKARTCILLQDMWGFSQREIAGLLKIPVSSVGSYIHRGREQLRQIYNQGGKVQ